MLSHRKYEGPLFSLFHGFHENKTNTMNLKSKEGSLISSFKALYCGKANKQNQPGTITYIEILISPSLLHNPRTKGRS